MATLPTKSFDTIVTNMVAGVQGRASKFINFVTGSSLRAIAEAFAAIFMWFQALALKVLQATRLSTSQGVDVDTFTADFMPVIGTANGVPSPRLGAQAASGNVTFSRFTAAPVTCFIPVGATVGTNDGSNTQFAVVANPTFGTFVPTPAPGGYVLPANVASILVPVQAVVAGAAGNVAFGAIVQITSPITGIDSVTNGAAFTNGADQESDSALQKRFSDYIQGLARGDIAGLNASIEGAAVNVQYTLTEDYNYDGSYHPGFFFVVADDGSGSPSAAFLAVITQAAQAVRPLSIQCAVFPPTVILANVAMQVPTLPGYDHNTVISQVAALIALNINQLGLGNSLPWNILSTWAYSIPGVDKSTGVSAVTLNGATGDAANLQATKSSQDGFAVIGYATIKAGVITVS